LANTVSKVDFITIWKNANQQKSQKPRADYPAEVLDQKPVRSAIGQG
jgi:hypothetical protein